MHNRGHFSCKSSIAVELHQASTICPLVAPLVQGGFPAVAGFAGAGIVPGVNIPAALDPVGVPSECLLLKNMFDPSTETEPEFDLDIKEECSKFGKLNHIFVDKNIGGFVYLRFENAQAAMGAQRALHGRLGLFLELRNRMF